MSYISVQYQIAVAPDAQGRLEHHWDSWITDQDWRWLVEHGFNSVRLPVSWEIKLKLGYRAYHGHAQIGYYHLVAAVPDVVKGTAFERVAAVFQGAWPRIQRAIETAGHYGIGVLLDLHCAAGV